MRRRARLATVLAVQAACAAPAWATIWNVGGSGPLTSIQAALQQAVAGDVVLVQPGFYYERIELRDGVAVAAQILGTVVVDAEAAGSAVSALGVGSSTTVTGLVFQHGSATSGGGFSGVDASPVFTSCSFVNNTAVLGGGAFLRDGSQARFVDCSFSANTASVGGGLYLDFSIADVSSCTISGNTASDGGALVAANGAEALFAYTSIYANTTLQGAAIACNLASPQFTNCTIAMNQGGAAAVAWRGSETRIERCIVALNASPAFVCAGFSAPWVGCDIVWGNGSDAICGGDQGSNLCVDPLFCDAAGNHFEVAANSPAVGGGCGAIGANPVACPSRGIGTAVVAASWSQLKALYRH